MAMSVPKAPGFSHMMKDGAKHFSGLEEAVFRNITACKELSSTTKSAFGPNGQNKMVINHLEKLFVTNDAATILRELDVQHPAAKIIVMASQQQEIECGDGTNFVLIFTGALLEQAEGLLRMGLSIPEIINGYELARKKAQEVLKEISILRVKDINLKEEIMKPIRSAVMSKQYGYEDFLAEIITDACLQALSKNSSFNVDNVRICKILGSGVLCSSVVNGMVFKRTFEGNVTKATDCKIAVYTCPLDIMQTETKGTVLIKTAKELKNYSQGEEEVIEDQIKSIKEAGCKVIVTGGKVGELALHYANKHNILVARIMSKFDLRRLCKSVGATALPRIIPPTSEELGYCSSVYVDEIGDTPVIVFKQVSTGSNIATLVIRGSTDNIMDDVERAVDDGVNVFKGLTRDPLLVAGAGATEMEISKKLLEFAETKPGLEQYSIQMFAEALEVVPRALSQNSGLNANDVIALLTAAHQNGNAVAGVDLEADAAAILNASEAQIYDLHLTKHWALHFATEAANTILNVDQIIMAKAAGGPKPKENKDWDED